MSWGQSTWGRSTWGSTTLTVAVTGVSVTGSVGNESLVTNNNLSVTGIAATSANGTATTNIVTPSGVAATSAIGTATASGAALVAVTGFGLTASSGEELVWGVIDTSQTPSWSEITTA